MKEVISKLLVKAAKMICPAVETDVYIRENEYEPVVCAAAYEINGAYIRKMKKAERISSSRKAVQIAIERELIHAKIDVCHAIEEHIMQQRVYKRGGSYVVEVRANCYVAKEA